MPPINLYSLPRQPEYEAMLWAMAWRYIASRVSINRRVVDMRLFEQRRFYG
jgi:hypothetical protein